MSGLNEHLELALLILM